MKNNYYKIIVFLFSLLFGHIYNAQSQSIYESYAILSINGAGNTFYDMAAATPNPDFQGANLGSFNSSQSIVVRGGQNKTVKCNGGNTTGGILYYRVWLTSAGPSGSFVGLPMIFGSDDPGAGSGCQNQSWTGTAGTTNIVSGLAAGNYTLEVYSEAAGSPSTAFSSNFGNNFRATFTVCGPSSGALTPGNYAIPGCFPTVAAAVTYLNTNGVTGTGTVQFDVAAGYTETAPAGGYNITATGTAANPIIFKKNGIGANPVITAPIQTALGSYTDAIIKIIGGDYITIDGFDLRERTTGTFTYTGNNATTGNNVTEWGIALLYATTTNGAQNNTIKNCTIDMDIAGTNYVGIYSNSTHSATAVGTTANATTATGANSNLTITGNTITDVNVPIAVIGSINSATDQNDGLTIGGSLANANNIANFGRVAPSIYQNFSGTLNGVLIKNTKNYNVSYNTISNTTIASAPSSGNLRGVFVDGYNSAPSGTHTATISNNKISLKASGADVWGIVNSASSGTPTTIDINNNEFSNFTVTGSGATRLIQNNQSAGVININDNQFIGLSIASTGNVTFIQNSTTATVSKSVSRNKTVKANVADTYSFTKSGAGNMVTLYTDVGSSGSGATVVNNDNDFSNLNLPASSTNMTGWFNQDAFGSSSAPQKTIENNKFENWTSVASTAFNVMEIRGIGGLSSIKGNTIKNITKTGSSELRAININDRTSASSLTIEGNTIENISSAQNLYGIITINATPTVIKGNTIKTLNGAGSLAAIRHATNTMGISIENNIIDGLTTSGTDLRGIQQVAAALTKIENNTISNLTTSATLAGTNIVGINCTNATGTTNTIKGNTINNLAAPSTVTTTYINGISVSASANWDISNNILRDFSSNSQNEGTGTNAAIVGIVTTSSGSAQKINNNEIYNLSLNNTNDNGVIVTAFANSSSLGGGEIQNNKIYNLINRANGTSATEFPFITAYYAGSSSSSSIPPSTGWTFANNMIYLDNGGLTNNMQCTGVFDGGATGTRNYFYNTIYIAGSSTGNRNSVALQFNSGTGTANVRNNILQNLRTGSGKNYAIANFTASLANFNSDNNILNTANPATVGATNGITDRDFATWQSATTKDTNSYTAEPISFVNPAIADLHINITDDCAANNIEGTGTAVAITTDYDATTRPNNPDIGADEVDFGRVAGNTPSPDITKRAIVSADYTTNSFECKCLQVNKNKVLTIAADTSVKVLNNITNNGKLIVESDGNLLQVNSPVTNIGDIQVRRAHTLTSLRKEYNFLSSPVADQNMKLIFGNNAANIPFVTKLNEPTNAYVNAVTTDWAIAGKGFSVKEPKSTGYVDLGDGLPNTMAQYKGMPNNGDVTLPLSYTTGRGYNLAGNPYPSNIDIIDLYANSVNDINSPTPNIDPTFRFWDNTVNDIYSQLGGAYQGYSYALFNAKTDTDGFGLEAPGNGTGPVGSKIPNRVIKVSQGFMVRARALGAELKFRNTQRKTTNASTVLYGKTSPRNRYRLQLVKSDGFTVQNGVAYFDAGNNAFGLEDSRIPNSQASDALFSYAGEDKVVINGRSTFSTEDVIPLGLRHFTSGTFTIQAIDEEGVFANGQTIYLKDKDLGILTDLTAGDYTFTSESGEFTNRFEIVYKEGTVLSTGVTEASKVEIYRDGTDFVVRSLSKNIEEVELYDPSGKLIFKMKGNSKDLRFNSERLVEGIYILKAQLKDGEQLTKKIKK